MHRMMPYELVGVPERQEVMEKINRDPNGWVQSLKTFGKYGFFIECDIEAPVELHDKFNDLPFFPVQVLRWNQEVRREERYCGQGERGEYTETHL